MSRRSRGRNVSGWLVVDKPLGVSSAYVVNIMRRAFDARKAGHSGTLDPGATGVLAIGFGEATKTIPVVNRTFKGYKFVVRLGEATTTDDAEGAIIAKSSQRPNDQEIQKAMFDFIGEIKQIPPKYSAIKVNGQRAYKLARKGIDFNLNERPLFVHSFSFLKRLDRDNVEFSMVCGKGGYIRSIARDLGQRLGCYGHIISLRRTSVGPFNLAHCTSLKSIEAPSYSGELDHYLLPLEKGLTNIRKLEVNSEIASRIRKGNTTEIEFEKTDFEEECWVAQDGMAVALGFCQKGQFRPTRVFVSSVQ